MQKFLLNIFSQSQLDRFSALFDSVFGKGNGIKTLTALVMVVFHFFTILIDAPYFPEGQELDLSEYTLVFEDEFEGETLDTEVWNYRATGKRRGGFNSSEQVRLENGNMILTGQYREDGEFGPGWYAGMVNLKERYTNGYFEIRCICNDKKGYWSAFWLQAEHPYDPEISKGGIGGAEIDIMEAPDYGSGRFRHFAVQHNIHCSGMEGDTSGELNSKRLGWFYGNSIYKEYNTYGLEWTEDEYIFYVNGVETTRSTWADGVSTVPEEVIVSLELPSNMDEYNYNKDTFKTEMVVDYVRIYQK